MVRNLPAEFKSYADTFQKFDDELVNNTHPLCNGCRNIPDRQYCIQGCFILDCTKERDIDFCGECPEFPCTKAKTFQPVVYERWLSGNREIADISAEAFYNEMENISHYIDFCE